MSRLRRWIEPRKDTTDEEFACLCMGGSIIIPCVWKFLGISNDISLDEMRQAREYVENRPPELHLVERNDER